jgi:hypothetical protein
LEEKGRVEVERGGVGAGRHSETPYVWRVCGSAGVTAGMASLAACSTQTSGVASLAARSTGNGAFSRACESTEIPGEGADTLGRTLGKVRLQGGRWVGRARKRLTTENTEDTQKSKPQRTRRTLRLEEKGRTRWSAPTRQSIGLSRGRCVKGAQAGWKAGRRLESLPHRERRVEVERAGVRAGWRGNSRAIRGCVALPA